MNTAINANQTKHLFKPLKIALLGYRSHPHVGGQGIYIKYLSRALTRLGHTVDVYSGPPYPELDENINLIKIPSLDLYAVEKPFRALRWRHLKSYTDTYEWWGKVSGNFAEPYTFGRRVEKILRNTHYDIIHDNQSLSRGLLKIQKHHKNLVTTIHHPIHRDKEIAVNAANTWGMKLLTKRWYSFLGMQERVAKQLNHIVTVSHSSKEDIQNCFKIKPSQINVIQNGVDTAIFKPNEKVQAITGRIITTASSDQPLKGLNTLLNAISILRKDNVDTHLRVIGKLKPQGQTHRLLKELNLEEHVSFISGISTQELVTEYNQAQIAVSPSLYEGFGLPVAEALSCGIPTICSNISSFSEVIGHAGIQFSAGDPHDLAKKITMLLADGTERSKFAKLGRKHILRHFCWNSVAEQLSAYYCSILSQAK